MPEVKSIGDSPKINNYWLPKQRRRRRILAKRYDKPPAHHRQESIPAQWKNWRGPIHAKRARKRQNGHQPKPGKNTRKSSTKRKERYRASNQKLDGSRVEAIVGTHG